MKSSQCTFLAHLYAAEALIHLNKFNQAIQHLNPANFPNLNMGQHEKQNNQSPKSSKSEREIDGKNENEELIKKENQSNSAPNCGEQVNEDEIEQKVKQTKGSFSNIK